MFSDKTAGTSVSVNAGDYVLCGGGQSINPAFKDELEKVMTTHQIDAFRKLHERLLRKRSDMNNEAVRATEHIEILPFLKRAGVKECIGKAGPAEGMGQPQRVGSAYLSIFHDSIKVKHQNNRGMMYVVGPKGMGHEGPKHRRIKEPEYEEEAFLERIKATTTNVMDTLAKYKADLK